MLLLIFDIEHQVQLMAYLRPMKILKNKYVLNFGTGLSTLTALGESTEKNWGFDISK